MYCIFFLLWESPFFPIIRWHSTFFHFIHPKLKILCVYVCYLQFIYMHLLLFNLHEVDIGVLSKFHPNLLGVVRPRSKSRKWYVSSPTHNYPQTPSFLFCINKYPYGTVKIEPAIQWRKLINWATRVFLFIFFEKEVSLWPLHQSDACNHLKKNQSSLLPDFFVSKLKCASIANQPWVLHLVKEE